MSRAASPLKSLTLENAKIQNEILKMRQGEAIQLQNSLASLLSTAQATTNLTSFNPIIQNNIYAPLTSNWTMLMYMYKTHGLIQTVIDMPVLDALRGGIDIESAEMDPDDIKEIQDYLEEFDVLGKIGEAMIWTRLFGGGALILNTGEDPEKPINPLKIKYLEIYPATRWELLSPYNPDASKFGNPNTGFATKDSEYVQFYNQRVHRSRVLTMTGKAAPYILRWQLAGWGMSEVERMVEPFNLYIKTCNVLYELLEEAKVDVYRLEGLNSQLSSTIGTQKTLARIALMNQQKNINSAVVMDMKDEFQQKQITFAGIAEVMKQNMMGIASAMRMPLTKIFGISASGFNSGEDDIENYNALVESEVRTPLRREIRKILNLIILARHGIEVDFKFSYKPLRVLGSVEEETVKTSKQNRYLAQFDRGLIDSEEFGQMAEKDGLNPIQTKASEGLLDEHPVLDTGGEDDDGPGKKGGPGGSKTNTSR